MDDLVRRLFGKGRGPRSNNWNEPPNSNKESHQDHDDVFIGRNGFFGPQSSGLDDMFEHFHRDMFQQMDSLHRQMEDIFKGFGNIDFPSDFSAPSMAPNDPENEGSDNKIFIWSGPSPFFRQSPDHSRKNPRDFMLKEDENDNLIQPEAIKPRFKQGPGHDMPRWDKYSPEKMEDTDLDGKLSDENVLALIKKPGEDSKTDVKKQPPQMKPGSFFSRQSVSISTFNGSDGKVEQKRVVRDSSGREESTVTRSIGDRSHTVTTVKDDSGAQEKHEELHNMNEGDLSKFEELWSKRKLERPSSSPVDSMLSPRAPGMLPVNPNDQGLFFKFFGGGKS
ncbi:hypothetical protein RRG08_051024 [Elysia crispata]|uniref:HCLS1-associated protein X-1 n=1 Tax=Elysia crispata TaxID=231223 RepID=A0AAE1DA12_9GAST|nr:hypothetical protein RRG08_051024 [Elysia crispata]